MLIGFVPRIPKRISNVFENHSKSQPVQIVVAGCHSTLCVNNREETNNGMKYRKPIYYTDNYDKLTLDLRTISSTIIKKK